jgi:uncharacterized membrane protein YbhN (UPF0104 family)
MGVGDAKGAWRRALSMAVRGGLVAGAVYFLLHTLQWQDRYVATIAGKEVVGVSVVRGSLGGAVALHLADSTVRQLEAPEEIASLHVRPGLKAVVARASAAAVSTAVLAYLLGLATIAARWWFLLRLSAKPMALSRCWVAFMRSQTVGLILPGSVGGDLYRTAEAVRAGNTVGEAVLSIALDRLVGLWVLILCASSAASLSRGTALGRLGPVLFLGAAVALPAALGLLLLVRRAPVRLKARLVALPKLWDRARAAPVLGMAPVVLSAVNAALQVGAVLLLLSRYCDGTIPLGPAALAVALGFVANALPILPGGVGVGEAAFVYLLGTVGIGPEPTLAATTTLRLIVYGVAAMGALLFLWRGEAVGREAVLPALEKKGVQGG